MASCSATSYCTSAAEFRCTWPRRFVGESFPLEPQREGVTANCGRYLAQCYLHLANLPTYPLDRFSLYEYTLRR